MNIVTHNLSAMNSSRQLKITSSVAQKTSEKLASGYRINRAADDAAGLAISEKMRAQIRGLDRGARNLQDGISYVQVADGALNEVHSILQRINELSVQAANDTNTASDREALNEEVQALKTEMERIFTTTSFNTIKIWPEESISNAPTQIGTTPVQALKVTTPYSQSFDLTNENYNKIAKDRYLISANDQGVHLSWTDYAGDYHETAKISWDELKDNNYSFQIADYFTTSTTSSLFDANGDPLFDFSVSFAVEDCATIGNMITAIDGMTMSSTQRTSATARFENADGTLLKQDSFYTTAGVTLSATKMYESHENATGDTGFDFDQASDTFLRTDTSTGNNPNLISYPTYGSVEDARKSTEGWTFSFELAGIGNVTATSDSIRYYSFDLSDSTKDIWWYNYKTSDGKIERHTYGHTSNTYGEGTLGSFMDCLTGPNDPNSSTDTPGLLDHVGTQKPEGYIYIGFTIKAGSENVGSFDLTVNVKGTDTEETVLNRLKNSLNANTILDIYTSDGTSDGFTVYKSTEKKSDADKPVYENHFSFHEVSLNIQSGPTEEDSMTIEYRCLRVEALGLLDTNLLTHDSSTNAIQEVNDAIQIISRERSAFGAYQNRMEHAFSVNKNTSENTSAAESRIRDADMAKEILNHSKESILLQASQAMLAQSNAASEGLLSLLK